MAENDLFEIESGEFIAFVGQSGAGKLTIVSLLARLYKPDHGEIRTDGQEIVGYKVEYWCARIGVVCQHPFIFNDILAKNIIFGDKSATRVDIEHVAQITEIDEFVNKLPNGYDSQLGDDGVRLSGGQRQRVALARALLKDADFPLLDQPTSDLDSNLEREVQDAIETMDRNYGTVTIAHRLSTIKYADRIYTVVDGEIVECGGHQELLDESGEYAELHTIQSKQ